MNKRHVLIVDDNQGIREALSELCEFEGLTVTTAENGSDALDKLAKRASPCWILLDLTMPNMNGLACLMHIRRQPDWCDIPVTLLSAAGRIREIAMEHDVDYLIKPVEIDDLMTRIRKYCE